MPSPVGYWLRLLSVIAIINVSIVVVIVVVTAVVFVAMVFYALAVVVAVSAALAEALVEVHCNYKIRAMSVL